MKGGAPTARLDQRTAGLRRSYRAHSGFGRARLQRLRACRWMVGSCLPGPRRNGRARSLCVCYPYGHCDGPRPPCKRPHTLCGKCPYEKRRPVRGDKKGLERISRSRPSRRETRGSATISEGPCGAWSSPEARRHKPLGHAAEAEGEDRAPKGPAASGSSPAGRRAEAFNRRGSE